MDVRVYPLDDQNTNTRAFASVALDDMVAIRGIRVIEGDKGLFVSMPQSYDKKADEYRDIVSLFDNDIRKELNKAVKEEYKRVDALPYDQRGYDKPEAGNMSGLNISDIKLDIILREKASMLDSVTVHGIRGRTSTMEKIDPGNVRMLADPSECMDSITETSATLRLTTSE